MKRILLAVAWIILALAPGLPADEFAGIPGLWKTTLRAERPGVTKPPLIQWHCVAEASSPWVAFAQLDVPPQAPCKQTDFKREETSLTWRLECTGQFAIINQGSIKFDKPSHYTGTVTLGGTILGYPINDVVQVEGEHEAACTSPAD